MMAEFFGGGYLRFVDGEWRDKNGDIADVVEVRRGEWVPQRLLGADVVVCSECKTLGSPQWKWCPVCGADMRGEKNES